MRTFITITAFVAVFFGLRYSVAHDHWQFKIEPPHATRGVEQPCWQVGQLQVHFKIMGMRPTIAGIMAAPDSISRPLITHYSSDRFFAVIARHANRKVDCVLAIGEAVG